jgi:hypothetical protein
MTTPTKEALIMRALISLAAVATLSMLQMSSARADEAGAAGRACYGNGTCNAGLTCRAGTCEAPAAGEVDGPCYGNGTCNRGLTCAATQMCVATAPEAAPPAPQPAPAAADAAAPAAITVASRAAARPSKSWWLAGKVGYLMSGSVYIEAADRSVDSDGGLAAMLEIDAAVAPRLAVGGFVFTASTGVEGTKARVTTVGGDIRARFPIGRFELRPGATLGYQLLTADDLDTVKGFDIGATVELAIPFTSRSDFLIELGFISQPSGGNDATDITFAPIFFVSAGASFGG